MTELVHCPQRWPGKKWGNGVAYCGEELTIESLYSGVPEVVTCDHCRRRVEFELARALGGGARGVQVGGGS